MPFTLLLRGFASERGRRRFALVMFALSLRICDGAVKQLVYFLGGLALLHTCSFCVLNYVGLTHLSMGWWGGTEFQIL